MLQKVFSSLYLLFFAISFCRLYNDFLKEKMFFKNILMPNLSRLTPFDLHSSCSWATDNNNKHLCSTCPISGTTPDSLHVLTHLILFCLMRYHHSTREWRQRLRNLPEVTRVVSQQAVMWSLATESVFTSLPCELSCLLYLLFDSPAIKRELSGPPSGPVVKTLWFLLQGHGFDPWLRSWQCTRKRGRERITPDLPG